MVAAVITWIAKNFGLLLIVVASIVTRVKVRRNLVAGRPGDAIWIGDILIPVVVLACAAASFGSRTRTQRTGYS